MKLKKSTIGLSAFRRLLSVDSGKTTTDETENTTKQESAVEETVQDEQETGDTETESEASGEDADKETEDVQRSLCHGYLHDADGVWGTCTGGG